jgi:ribosomal protein S18 acetylase RimI-like enzyme
MAPIAVRKAAQADLPALGRLGALLMCMHHDFDAQRFMAPGPSPERGYAWFLGTQLAREDAAILVAEGDGAILGYVYAAVEPQSWQDLRDEAGYIHDVVVDPDRRRQGVATALMEAALEWLRGRGVPRVVLGTASRNTSAQRLFARLGFRPTMIELTREL